MADTPNTKSGPVNKLIETVGARDRAYTEGTAQIRHTEAELRKASQDIAISEAAINAGLPEAETKILERMGQRGWERERTLGPRLDVMKETSRERLVNGVRTDISRSFAATRTGISAASMSAEVNAAAIGGLSSSYATLEKQRAQHMNAFERVEAATSRVADEYLVNGEINPSAKSRIAVGARLGSKYASQIAEVDASMRMHKMMGTDTISQQRSLIQSVGFANSVVGANDQKMAIANKTGMAGKGIEEVYDIQVKAAKDLVEAFKELTNGVQKSDKEISELNTAIAENQAKLKESSDLLGGGGGGGRGGRRGMGATPYIDAIGTVAGGIGQVAQSVGVNQRIATQYNIAGLAGIENEKYAMYQRARGGDVASQMALSSWKGAEDFGSSVKVAANVAVAGSGVSHIANAISGGTKGAAMGGLAGSFFGGVGAVPGAILGGITGAVGGVVGGISAGGDMVQQVSGDQAKIAATNARMQAIQAVNAVPAQQLQGFRDFTVGSAQAARGMGSGGAKFLAEMNSDDSGPRLGMLSRMAGAGISPEQMTQMAQTGQANMGSMFDKEQIFQARGLEKSGMGTMAENQQRQSMLAAAGSNNPQAGLTTVLEAAFGRSLDNAKTLTALVQNTAEMAQTSGAGRSGLDTMGAQASILAAATDAGQPNREAALVRARSAAEAFNTTAQDESISYNNQMAMARIGKTTGLGGQGQIMAGKLTVGELNTLKGKSAAEQEKYMLEHGVNFAGGAMPNKPISEQIDTLLLDAKMKVIGKGTVPVGIDTAGFLARAAKADKEGNYNYPNDAGGKAMQANDAAAAIFAGLTDQKTAFRTLNAQTAPNELGAVEGVGKQVSGEAGSEALKAADKLMTGGATQLAEAAKAAADALGGTMKAVEMLTKLQEAANKEGGTAGEKKMGDAAGIAAGASMFSKGAETFSDAATMWKGIGERLIAAGIGSTRGISIPSGDKKQ